MKQYLLTILFCLGMLPTQAQVVSLTGRYDVPVDEQELAPFASFDMSSPIFFTEGESLSYKLPPSMMTDEAKMMEFIFNEESGLYESQHGVGKCEDLNEAVVKCDIAYSDSYGDIIREVNPHMEDFLRDHLSMSEEEIKQRMRVLDGFSGDPIGSLFIYKSAQY